MPKFDDYGTLKGLAYQHNWQQATDNMLKFEQFKQQQQLQREKKSQYYADRIKRGSTSTEYNSKRLQKYYDGLNTELGEFLVKNPNWEQDMLSVNEFNALTDKYLNNPIMREDMDAQKDLELIRQDRNNMSTDHFNMLMEQYDRYDTQEVGEDPLSEDGMKFRYVPESRLDFTGVVKIVNDLTGIMEKSYTDADGTTKRVTFVPQEKLDTAKSMVYSNKEYYRASKSAYDTYIQNAKNNIYTDFDDFLEDSIKNPKNLQDIYQKVAGGGRGGLGDGSDWAVPRYTSLVQELINSQNGRIKVSDKALALTDAGKVGRQIDLSNSGTLLVFTGPDGKETTMNASKFSYSAILGAASAVTAKEMYYNPENKSSKMRIVVNIPMISGANGESNPGYKELEKLGWKETKGQFSEFGFVISEVTGATKYLTGEVYVDAHMDSPEHYYSYNDQFGSSIKDKQASDFYKAESINQYNSYADFMNRSYADALQSTENFKNGKNTNTPDNSDPDKEYELKQNYLNEEQKKLKLNALK